VGGRNSADWVRYQNCGSLREELVTVFKKKNTGEEEDK